MFAHLRPELAANNSKRILNRISTIAVAIEMKNNTDLLEKLTELLMKLAELKLKIAAMLDTLGKISQDDQFVAGYACQQINPWINEINLAINDIQSFFPTGRQYAVIQNLFADLCVELAPIVDGCKAINKALSPTPLTYPKLGSAIMWQLPNQFVKENKENDAKNLSFIEKKSQKR